MSKRSNRYKLAPSPEEHPIWTTWELAVYLDTNVINVQRWCKKWFGELEKGYNVGPHQGYRIPWQYVYVARAYLSTEDERMRKVIANTLVAHPADWVVVVDGEASTHYTVEEAVLRAAELKQVASIIYAGEFRERLTHGTRPRYYD